MDVPPKISNNAKIQESAALRRCISNPSALAQKLSVDEAEQHQITKKYRVRIPDYYLNLIEEPNDPIWRQAIPDSRELEEDGLPEDPYSEDDPKHSPTSHLTHRYPDRVLLLVTSVCPMYCRYCMRKRKTQKGANITQSHINQGIEYIRQTPEVREVILSGGDPFMLSNQRLQTILIKLQQIPHVEMIRIHTRMPCVQPQRITPELANMLGQFHPLFVVVHFNHPREITTEAKQALDHLINAGIPLANQSVLLKDINDHPTIIKELCLKLLKTRVQPYYLHQADLVHGTSHFRTRVETGLGIIQSLRGKISGLAIPQYVIDCPGGGGKIPLLPDDGQQILDQEVKLKNYEGQTKTYPQVPFETDHPAHQFHSNTELLMELEQNPYGKTDLPISSETPTVDNNQNFPDREQIMDSEKQTHSVASETIPIEEEDPFTCGQHHEKEGENLAALVCYQQAIDNQNEQGVDGIERLLAKSLNAEEQLKLLKEGIRNNVTECYYYLAKFYEAHQDLANALMAVRRYNKLTSKKYKKGTALVEVIFSQM
ncbi:MAG: KamA family radical SAM protein [SAR324 cluster bacterium]|nr:KamA family radical SAM protein [SAR324 cluster bacterium]